MTRHIVAFSLITALLVSFGLTAGAETKIEITMKAREEAFAASDEMTLDFTVKNAGAEDFVNAEGIRFEQSLTARDGSGAELKRAEAAQKTGAEYQPRILAPGCSFTAVLPLKTLFPDLAKPGTYCLSWKHAVHGTVPDVFFEVYDVTKQTIATIETNFGNIVLTFFPEDAPKHVENFIALAKKKFYDGLTFHRIIKGFMMQGGCPSGDGSGGPGYSVKAEFNKRKHVAGTLSMARSTAPDTAGSQFFICFEPQERLDGNYTVFGQVVKGMDVVKKIERECATTGEGKPPKRVNIIKVVVSEPQAAPPPEKTEGK